MKGTLALLTAVAAATLLSAVAAAEPAATKQRVAITVRFHEKSFVLSPLQAGALKSDSGTITGNTANGPCRNVIRDGQKVGLCSGRSTLESKRGTITFRTQEEWVDSGNAACGIGFGTWKVVRGTGEYAGIAGGGRSAYEAHCQKWYARHEGFLLTR